MKLPRAAVAAILGVASMLAGCGVDRSTPQGDARSVQREYHSESPSSEAGTHATRRPASAEMRPPNSATSPKNDAESFFSDESKETNMRQLDSKYQEGMSYHVFRKMLLGEGWSPAANSTECLRISVGENYKDICAKDNSPGMCSICAEFPEIDACTDDGYCYMSFSRGHEALSIKNYGDVLRIREENSEPIVQEWTISTRHE